MILSHMKPLAQAKLSDQDRAAIEAAAEMLRERFGATGVILFGSKARGDDTPDSDIDLLVLLPRDVAFAERLEVSGALSPLGRKFDVLFNTVVAPASRWPDHPYPLSVAARVEGVAA